MKSIKQYSSICIAMAVLLFLFQNCSQGFQTIQSSAVGDNTGLGAGTDITAPPIIDFVIAPPSFSNLRSHTFKISLKLDPKAKASSVLCQLDSEPQVDCASLTWTLSNLTDGDHILKLSATDSLRQTALGKSFSIRIDGTAPLISISQQPASVTGSTSANIAFTALDVLSGVQNVECALDNGSFNACSSPVTLGNLSTGSHSFKIRASDKAGNISGALSFSWVIDLSAPSISIGARPAATVNSTSASFEFTGSSSQSTISRFECSLDGATYAVCTSPKAFSSLAQGSHTFSVRAITAAGVTSAPISANWVVDTVAPPAPTISTTAVTPTRLTEASFSFIATDLGSTVTGYQCSLDGAVFSNCTSPLQLKTLSESSHELRVKAVDGAGNISNHASFTWLVDLSVSLAFTTTPDPMTTETTATFAFSATDVSGISSLTCQLDAEAAATCTSPKVYSNISVGSHSVKVTATDKAGNRASVTHSWVVNSVIIDGVALYANNCASCHAALASSLKLGRSAVQIATAITSIPQMAGLKNTLSSPQIAAIADALSSPNPGPVAGNSEDKAPDASLVNSCTTSTVRGLAQQSNRKLTKMELFNTMKELVTGFYEFDVLQPFYDFTYVAFANQTLMQQALNAYPEEYSNVSTMGEVFEKVHNQEQINAWISFADAFGQRFSSSDSYYNRYSSSTCLSGAADNACFSDFVRRFGRQALRRPLTDDEVSRYVALKGADTKSSIALITSAILISPDFMFHLEAGTADSTTRIRLTDYEVANRISYGLTSAPPDSTLAKAAEQGQLKTLDQVESHVNRLLPTERAKKKLQRFFAEWLRLDAVQNPHVLWTMASEIGAVPYFTPDGIADASRKEVYDFVNYVVWTRNGSFNDLMTMKVAFPREVKLSRIYGTSTYSANGDVQTAPNNPGLLTRVGVLSSAGINPNAIMRGVNVKRRILCDAIPSPDFSTVASRVAELGELDPIKIPNHQIVSQTTNSTACMSCHSSINPIGFIFESYNPLGQKQTLQNVPLSVWNFPNYGKNIPTGFPQGAEARIFSQFALPTSQNIVLDAGLPTSYSSSDDFIDAIAKSDEARACMTVRLFRHIERRSEKSADACALNEMQTLLRQNQPILSVFAKSIANEDIFWRKPK